MAGQQDGGFGLLVVIVQKFPDAALGQDIQPDGRLVQVQDLRAVQKRGDQLHLHPLAQRKPPHLHLQQAAHVQKAGQLVQRAPVPGLVDLVDAAVQLKGVQRGQVGPELGLLPHHDGKPALIIPPALPGQIAGHRHGAAGGVQDAGKHFQRGGLAGAVGAKQAHRFALFNGKADAVDRGFLQGLPRKQVVQRAFQPLLLDRVGKGFGQVFDRDDLHGVRPRGRAQKMRPHRKKSCPHGQRVGSLASAGGAVNGQEK